MYTYLSLTNTIYKGRYKYNKKIKGYKHKENKKKL